MYRDNASRTSLNDTDSTTEPETPQTSKSEEATVDTTEEKPTLLSISQKSEGDSDNNANLFGDFTSASSEPAVNPPPTAKPVVPTAKPPAENNLFGDLADLNLSAPAKQVSSNTSTNFDEFDVFKSAPGSTTTQAPISTSTNIDLNSLLQTSSNTIPNQTMPTQYTMPPANQSYYYPPGGVYVPTQQVSYHGYQPPQYIPPMSNPYPAQNTRYMAPTQQQANTAFLPPPMQPTKFPPNTFQSQNQSPGNAKISNGNVSEKKSRDPFGDLNVFGQK